MASASGGSRVHPLTQCDIARTRVGEQEDPGPPGRGLVDQYASHPLTAGKLVRLRDALALAFVAHRTAATLGLIAMRRATSDFGDGDALAHLFDGTLTLDDFDGASSRARAGAGGMSSPPRAVPWLSVGAADDGAGAAFNGSFGSVLLRRPFEALAPSTMFGASQLADDGAPTVDDVANGLPLSHLEVSAAPRGDSHM